MRWGNPITTAALAIKSLKLAIGSKEEEHFQVLYLNSSNCLIAAETNSIGTITQTTVYPREVAKRALQLNAVSVILGHNHPSGRCGPSEVDKSLTTLLVNALTLIDVKVLDHLIVSGSNHYSFAEHGLL